MPFTPHDLRHGHATWLLADGVPLTTVRDRLGHSSIAVTSIYLHDLDEGGVLGSLDRLFGDPAA
jgi:integrase